MEDQQEFSPQVPDSASQADSESLIYKDYLEMKEMALTNQQRYMLEHETAKNYQKSYEDEAKKFKELKDQYDSISEAYKASQEQLKEIKASKGHLEITPEQLANSSFLKSIKDQVGGDVHKAILEGRLKVRPAQD